MTDAAFTFTDRARPVCEIGIGDSRVDAGQARWDIALWDGDTARWAGTEPTWLDVACDVERAECEYGRAATTARFVPGTATVLVNNETGWADPGTSDVPGVLTLRPGRPIRFGAYHATLGYRWVFRGFIDDMRPTYLPDGTDAVELHCVDALGEVNRAKFIGYDAPVGAGETATARVARILDRALWPQAKRSLAPTSTALIGSVLEGQAADLLGVVSESEGGAIFGDLDGNVVLRGRDWQSFPAGTPPDGVIGNVDPGTPGYWEPGTPQVDGYLTPSVGTVSTPDNDALTISGPVRITARVRKTAWRAGPNYAGIATRRASSATNLAFATYVRTDGQPGAEASANGTAWAMQAAAMTPAFPDSGAADVTIGFDLDVATARIRAQFDGGLWAQSGTFAPFVGFDSTAPLIIGATAPAFGLWDGRIYWAQMETLDAEGNPTGLVWRFDASEYPGGGVTSYTDPRGRTWTLTSAAAITPAVPEVPPEWVPPVPGDVCPSSWTRPFARADMSTRVILGRDDSHAAVPTPWIMLDDREGIVMFGIEPFERTYLLTRDDDDLYRLAARILETRSYENLPRVRNVVVAAETSDEALDLLCVASPFVPSRYRCRLRLDRGDVFDEEMFVTGVRHEIERDAWRAQYALDAAAPFAISDVRWDSARWDVDTWTLAI